MSIFESVFKLNKSFNNENEYEKKLNLLNQVTNGKMSLKEVERVYKILDSQVIKKAPKNLQIIEAMDLIKEVKGEWLTDEEKENFVAGVWMFDTLDTSKKENLNYINSEQLKYVKQAVLGNQFKAAREDKYYSEIKEYKLKY